MKPLPPPIDAELGMLQARLRFWLTVPAATAMHSRLEAEIKHAMGARHQASLVKDSKINVLGNN